MSVDFPPFALSEEHEALRESVRALADDKIAPRAAEIDRTGEFPWDVYEALVKADLRAAHIPFILADMAMHLEAARQLTYAAAARSVRAMAGEQVADLTFFSSACKCLASDVAMSVTTDAQVHGVFGPTDEGLKPLVQPAPCGVPWRPVRSTVGEPHLRGPEVPASRRTARS
jgi:alkylation response protein AidB-like acyl-CoA dehydrogenase